jgi:hypothetical protein
VGLDGEWNGGQRVLELALETGGLVGEVALGGGGADLLGGVGGAAERGGEDLGFLGCERRVCADELAERAGLIGGGTKQVEKRLGSGGLRLAVFERGDDALEELGRGAGAGRGGW